MNDQPTSLAVNKPIDAPAWAFWWDSNRIWGWIASEAHWSILVTAFGHPAPTDPQHPLQGKCCKYEREGQDGGRVFPDYPSYGFRGEHTGSTLREYAEQHGLTWMLEATAGVPAAPAQAEHHPLWWIRHPKHDGTLLVAAPDAKRALEAVPKQDRSRSQFAEPCTVFLVNELRDYVLELEDTLRPVLKTAPYRGQAPSDEFIQAIKELRSFLACEDNVRRRPSKGDRKAR